jgi:hypothetical protein
MEVSGQLHAPAALPQHKGLPCPLNRRLGGPPNRSGWTEEEKNLLPLPGIELRFLHPHAVANRYTNWVIADRSYILRVLEITYDRDRHYKLRLYIPSVAMRIA